MFTLINFQSDFEVIKFINYENIIKFAGMTSSSSFRLKHTLLQVIGIAISTFRI